MASIEFIVNAIDEASGTFEKVGLSADVLSRQLDDLSKKVATPVVDLNDRDYSLKLADAAVKLDRLSKKIAKPDIDLQGYHRVELDILKLDAMIDELNHKKASVTVEAKKGGGLLSRAGDFIKGLPSKGGGFSGLYGLAGAGSDTTLSAGPIGWGALIAGALALGPALIPTALGGGIGGAGALGALKLANSVQNQLFSQQSLLNSIKTLQQSTKPLTATQQRTLSLDQAKYSAGVPVGELRELYNPLSKYQNTFQNLGRTALVTFAKAVTSGGNNSFLSGMDTILKQVSEFIKDIGPGLAKLFQASLPFVSAFVKILEQFGRIVLPAITQSLKEMAPSLPIMIQGFRYLSEGIAGWIRDLGPGGMKDAAIIFKGAMEVVLGVMDLLGVSMKWTAIAIVKTAEGIRTFARDIPPFFDRMFADIASTFDTWRHGWASDWDTLWSNTIGALIRFISTANRDLSNWGNDLKSLGSAAFHDFLSGLESVGSVILNWLHGFATSVINKVKSFFGIASPSSVFHEIGVNIAHGLANGIKAGVTKHMGGAIGALHGGIPSGLAGTAQHIAAALLPRYGWAGQWPALNAIEMAEAGWNLRAQNPTSGAYGLAQFINGPSEYYQYGGNPTTASGQVVAWFNYIKQRYGTPDAAWRFHLAHGWYGSGLPGAVFTRPTVIGVGERGAEEVTVTPLSQGGGLGPKLDRLNATMSRAVKLLEAQPAQNGKAFGDALNGVTRSAAYAGRYSSR